MHQNGEISVRDRSAPYKGGMFTAYPGDVVFSKMGARDGAIGVLQQDIARAVVTSEFPVFAPESDRLDGGFAQLALRTGGVLAALGARASGSGRKRVSPEAFADLRVPLPPLPEQRAIAAAHRAAMARAAAMEREAEEIEARAMAGFEAALGFAPPAPLPDRPVFVASFKDLDRWSHEGILRHAVGGAASRPSRYPSVRLQDVIDDLENGWSPKCHDEPAKANEWGVLKLGSVSFGVFNPSENKSLPKHFDPRPRLEVAPGQLLISRANITRLVGATAVIGKTRRKLLLCDKIFRVIPCNSALIDLKFLAEILRTSDVRRQIETKVTGTSPTMKNISKPALMALTFPLPSRSEQNAMTENIDRARAAATDLRKRARGARTAAWANFESAVYTMEGNSEISGS